MGAFEKAYRQFLAEKVNADRILSKKEQVVADINRLLGILEPPTEQQYKLLSELVSSIGLKLTRFFSLDPVRNSACLWHFLREKVLRGCIFPSIVCLACPLGANPHDKAYLLQLRVRELSFSC